MAPGERGAPSLRAPLRQPRARFSMVVLIGAVLAPAFVAWMSWTCFIGAHRSWQQSPSPDSSVTRHFMSMQDPTGRDKKSRRADVAIAIGKDAAKRRGRLTKKADIEKARQTEIRYKIAVLKGRKRLYSRKSDRNETAVAEKEDDKAELYEEDDEDTLLAAVSDAAEFITENEGPEDFSKAAREAAATASKEALWPVPLEDKESSPAPSPDKPKERTVSDVVRALVNTELEGRGSNAPSRMLIDASDDLCYARQYDQAAAILEIARKRIDMEQIRRDITLQQSQELSETAMWKLADAYYQEGILTKSFKTYTELKEVLPSDTDGRREAEKRWAEVGREITDRLFLLERFDECIDLINKIREGTSWAIMGTKFMEELELHAAMTMQKTGQIEDAINLLTLFMKASKSGKRKMQAQFIMDVIRSPSNFRNDELHEIFEQTWRVTEDMRTFEGGSYVGAGRSPVMFLSERERSQRAWISEYWEERLKSPLYYAFLVLWVCWPFAIPVIAIWKRSGATLPTFTMPLL
eukprot:TRINITY_DN121673_c0_g1_i1.p1 TRINITY_DN121673_c0_g1~~TRINITY_DN121673_c0_g1_i1.p1  ORF type:complete len:559 (-),score=106.41 TRINITY_DN121673_c0_g1_i1:281-1849(-)